MELAIPKICVDLYSMWRETGHQVLCFYILKSVFLHLPAIECEGDVMNNPEKLTVTRNLLSLRMVCLSLSTYLFYAQYSATYLFMEESVRGAKGPLKRGAADTTDRARAYLVGGEISSLLSTTRRHRNKSVVCVRMFSSERRTRRAQQQKGATTRHFS